MRPTSEAEKWLLASPRNAHGAFLNRCDDNCVRPTPAQAHCAARGCHTTFGGVRGFDAHRRFGVCVDPASLGMELRWGVWRTPMGDEARSRLAAAIDGE